MSEMTGCSPGQIHRPLYFTIRTTAAANIPLDILPAMAGILQADAYAGFGEL